MRYLVGTCYFLLIVEILVILRSFFYARREKRKTSPSEEELKSKILFLYENQYISFEMGKLAQKKIKKYFSWESYGENVISAYQNLLKK